MREQGTLLWEAVSQRQVWLPALFIFLWQATPSSDGAFFYFITDELGIGPEFLGRVRVGTSLASLLGIWLYRNYLQEVPLKRLFVGLSLSGTLLGLSQLLLVTHYNRELGIPDTWFTFGDDLVLTVLGELAFMPLLVLAAALCPARAHTGPQPAHANPGHAHPAHDPCVAPAAIRRRDGRHPAERRPPSGGDGRHPAETAAIRRGRPLLLLRLVPIEGVP